MIRRARYIKGASFHRRIAPGLSQLDFVDPEKHLLLLYTPKDIYLGRDRAIILTFNL